MITRVLPLPWLLLGLLVLLAASFGSGYFKGHNAATERCEQSQAQAAQAAAQAQAALYAQAEAAEAAAAATLSATRQTFTRRLEAARRETDALATGRDCLGPDLRLRLNAALAPATGLPAGAAPLDPAPAEPATDTGVAQWILDAAQHYDECRARIDAIREWDMRDVQP